MKLEQTGSTNQFPWKPSIASTNSYGDNGLACLSPLPPLI